MRVCFSSGAWKNIRGGACLKEGGTAICLKGPFYRTVRISRFYILSYHQHRHFGVANYLISDASQEEPLQT
jgi:hypothetical protein